MSILQHHNSKTSILLLSDFCMVQFPHPYVTTGKTIALNIWEFAGKVMSLLFNTLLTVTAAMKLKAACSLEGKLRQT